MRKPRDHVRLARAFDIPPTKATAALWMTGTLATLGMLVPILLVPASAVLAGLGGYAADDRRIVAKGLREVDAFGFPVEGYRAWLLADEPAFDIEVRREVDVEVLRTSSAAIDPTIVVAKLGPRVFRIATRRVAIPSAKPHQPPLHVGDRRLLKELHRRILAPLQADVGIVMMRMGDAATLTPLVATHRGDDEPAQAGGGHGAFRESAMAAPPALQALVHVGGERALPHEARKLRLRSERVMHAANASPSGAGTVAALTIGGLTAGGQFGLPGIWIGLAGGFVTGVVAVVSGNRQNARSVARAVTNQGFPIEDYEDWLLAGRPLFDIETERPIERDFLLSRCAPLVAWSVSTQSQVSWVEDVQFLEPNLVRIETRPAFVQPPTSRIEPFYGGSHQMFRAFMADVLAPLHAHAGIVVVRMGGYIDRRV